MNRIHWLLGIAACLPSTAWSQPLPSMLSITHNHPTGEVVPGETVRLTATLDWGDFRIFAQIKGGVIATPNRGTAAGNVFPHPGYTPPVGTIANPGVAVGGSIEGVHLLNSASPGSGLPFAPPWFGTRLDVVAFDWTAPADVGPLEFRWLPDASLPYPLLWASLASSGPVPFPTTYVGTTLTVIPGPGAGVVLAAVGVVIGRRRRV